MILKPVPHPLCLDADLLSLPVEQYLHDFRGGLLALPESERDQIVSEVRLQVGAQAREGEAAVQRLLRRLGSPEQLAAQFTLRHELALGVQQSNPLGLLWVLLRLASTSVIAFFGGMAVFILLVAGFSLMILPIVKIMYPHGVDIPAGAGWAAMEFRVEPSNLVPAGYVPLPFMHAFVVGVVGVVLVGMAVALLRSLGRSLLRGVKRRTQMSGS